MFNEKNYDWNNAGARTFEAYHPCICSIFPIPCIQEDQMKPFPTGGEWEHCRGTTPQFRGYTCGLWTLFHAVTVSAYRGSSDGEY